MAQSVEQLIRNQQVAGSSPASSSKKYPDLMSLDIFLLFVNLDGLEGGSRFTGVSYINKKDCRLGNLVLYEYINIVFLFGVQ